MSNYVTPNDVNIMGYDDSSSIQNAVDYASEHGINRVVIPRKNLRTGESVWTIARTILLPSHMTVILDNCYMVLADGVYSNMFRNKNLQGKVSHKLEDEQCDITIRGEGYSILDGGKSNFMFESTGDCAIEGKGVTENPEKELGMRVNNMVLFHNVRDFVIENFEVRHQRWWAFNFMFCRNGRISDITSKAMNNIPNQDCVHLTPGCHHFVIERVSGQSADDLIALCALSQEREGFEVDGKDFDIHDIVIRDVIGTSVINGLVVLRNQDEQQFYNIEIENIIESNMEDLNNRPYVAVCLGQNDYIKKKASPIGSARNINVKTVISDNASTLQLAATLQDCKIQNIRCLGGRYAIISKGVKMKNVKIKGVYIAEKQLEMPLRFTRQPYSGNPIEFNVYERDEDYMEQVSFEDIVSEYGRADISLKADNKNEITWEGKKR